MPPRTRPDAPLGRRRDRRGARLGAAGPSFLLVARLPRPEQGADQALGELVRLGFGRRLEGGAVVPSAVGDGWPAELDPLPLVLGRFRAAEESRARVAATIEDVWKLDVRTVEAHGVPEAEGGSSAVRYFGLDLSCVECGTVVRSPTPALFSFNSPLGACPTCEGFGRVIGIDPERVVPDPRKSLAERPIAPWNTPAYEELYGPLLAAAKRRGVPLDRPWSELPPDDVRWIWKGEPGRKKSSFTSLDGFFGWLEGKTYKVHVRVLLARYRSYNRCPDCGGGRLNAEAMAVRFEGLSLPELLSRSVEALRAWLADRRFTPRQIEIGEHLLEELGARLSVLERVGLDYLTLDRQARTLSGGEAQRLKLASFLGRPASSGRHLFLFVLDEPTIGLHPQDSERLLKLLRDLASRGNSVLVVEHDRTLILGADHLIDVGPAAGEAGGEIVAEGSVDEVLSHPTSLTARFLRERAPTAARSHVARYRRERGRLSVEDELLGREALEIRGARENNLAGIDVDLPLDALVAVTGVSGSGKSTLVESVLYGNYRRFRGAADVEAGACDEIRGLELLDEMTMVDQSPIGRSTRSNPVTYIRAYDDFRKIFAGTEDARRRGITPAHFSFNVEAGRCPQCKGTGVEEVDMQFMAPVVVACAHCQGRRFRPDVLAVRHLGRDIAETLDLTVDEALEIYAREKPLCRKLGPLAEVGLGYLRLGQPTSTLSGGEAQRLKLASFLGRPARLGTPSLPVRRADHRSPPRRHRAALPDSAQARAARRRGRRRRAQPGAPGARRLDRGSRSGRRKPGGQRLYCGPFGTFLDESRGPTARMLRSHLGWRVPRGASSRMRDEIRTPQQNAERTW
ncbi:MAG: ATP-binding cassette domain-containing protein [Thermoanaerobaculia bacterium]